MNVRQYLWTHPKGWSPALPAEKQPGVDLLLIFGGREVLTATPLLSHVRELFPGAHVMGCSTSGEISGTRVVDDSLSVTAITFAHTAIRGGSIRLIGSEDGSAAGERLARLLDPEGLVHAFVLSDGLSVNGSELVKGLTSVLPAHVSVTGGLAGDGARFGETVAFWDAPPETNTIAIVGFYGQHIKVGYGSLGGWDPFGPERLITRSNGNILYELDGHSALELYKKYLGEQAKGLPATGLLFPLSLRLKAGDTGVVRTILSVDEKEQSVTFAGDIPEGSYGRLMKANFDRLIDGAVGAAKASVAAEGSHAPEFAVLISCVGRKLVLKQRVEEEVEGVRDVLGAGAVLTGFYSYGELSPFTQGERCELHNQTMTITTFCEA